MVSREPDFSAASALCTALSTMASKSTSCGVLGLASARLASIMRAKLFIDAAAVNANPNRLIVAAGRFHHHRKIVAVVFSLTDVTGVDAVLGKGLGTLRDFG